MTKKHVHGANGSTADRRQWNNVCVDTKACAIYDKMSSSVAADGNHLWLVVVPADQRLPGDVIFAVLLAPRAVLLVSTAPRGTNAADTNAGRTAGAKNVGRNESRGGQDTGKMCSDTLLAVLEARLESNTQGSKVKNYQRV